MLGFGIMAVFRICNTKFLSVVFVQLFTQNSLGYRGFLRIVSGWTANFGELRE